MINLITAILNFLNTIIAKKPIVKKCITENTTVSNLLKTILYELNADRVYLCQFHNGGTFYTGKAQQKFSTTFEVLSKGVSVGWNEKNVPVSLYNYALNKCIMNKFNYSNIKEINDLATVSRLQAKGIKSIAWIPIMGKNDLLMFVGIDWVKEKHAKIDVQRISNRLQTIYKYL